MDSPDTAPRSYSSLALVNHSETNLSLSGDESQETETETVRKDLVSQLLFLPSLKETSSTHTHARFKDFISARKWSQQRR
jgi:hypothetical protein